MPVGSTGPTFAPTATSATTPGEPSAFMTTTAQRPFFRCQRRSCAEEATQNDCVAGAAGTRVPAWSAYVTRNGETSKSSTVAEETPRRYVPRSLCRATPRKRGCAPLTFTRILSTIQCGTALLTVNVFETRAREWV